MAATMNEGSADQPTAGRRDGHEHVLPARVYWEDTDASGIVYHANYLRFFERGRSDSLRLLGLGQRTLLDEGLAFVVRSLTLDFRKPARLDDALQIRSSVAELSGASLIMRQRLLREREELVTADVRLACIEPAGRPRRIPSTIAALLATLSPNS
jgi:acyl-CoA thioester hydrolase